MANEVKSDLDINYSSCKFKKLDEKNNLKNNISSPLNNNEIDGIINYNNINNNNSSKSENANKMFSSNSEIFKNFEKYTETNLNEKNLNKNNKNQKKKFLYLRAHFEKKKNILSLKIKGPKNLIIRNKFFNPDNKNNYNNINLLPKLNLRKKNLDKNAIYYIGGDFSLNKKYISDILSENREKSESKKFEEISDMETADIKIEQLAKDVRLFQNQRNFRKINIYDSFNKKIFSDNEYYNILPMINSDNSSYINSNSQSRISSGIPRSRLFSGKFSNYSEIYGSNKNLNLKKLKRLNSPSFFIGKFKNLKNNFFSPIKQKSKDKFLYNKIFYYFSKKNFPML